MHTNVRPPANDTC